ncbi:GNAT family N-acetyltransferase [Maritalea mediterranea]|uniref:GNAT family N-acetyltransferase n=1 Tax=Maritalea mediterranea TaxID=2909667 RepID=A0ABS9E8W6_9HYPH|nr:GNAT family N-acetyltransferase [Maritalea mediterranea]MCF4099287.1 GNAT family N-acetyltransferase [Maritalea mediterranea]
MADRAVPRVRTATLEDEAAISHICVCTADSGGDARALYSRHDLPGLIWAVPYLHYNPSHCFVVDDGSAVLGYIVTVANTRAYEAWQHDHWWPAVEEKLRTFTPQSEADSNFLKALAHNQKPAPAFADDYPAHLHINLLPQAQGGGFGGKLMHAALDRLRADGVSGIHLGVNRENHRAIGFYKAMGFEQVADESAPIFARAL